MNADTKGRPKRGFACLKLRNSYRIILIMLGSWNMTRCVNGLLSMAMAQYGFGGIEVWCTCKLGIWTKKIVQKLLESREERSAKGDHYYWEENRKVKEGWICISVDSMFLGNVGRSVLFDLKTRKRISWMNASSIYLLNRQTTWHVKILNKSWF